MNGKKKAPNISNRPEMYSVRIIISLYLCLFNLSNYLFLLPGVTVEDVKKCLGYHIDANIAYKNIQANYNIDGGKCEKIHSKDKCKYILDLSFA